MAGYGDLKRSGVVDMYRYALSVKSELVEADDWSRELKMSRLKRIESSCGSLEELAIL